MLNKHIWNANWWGLATSIYVCLSQLVLYLIIIEHKKISVTLFIIDQCFVSEVYKKNFILKYIKYFRMYNK